MKYMNLIKVSAVVVTVLHLLAACSNDSSKSGSDTANGSLLKYGIIKNGCNEMDLPPVRIILTNEEMLCEDSHSDYENISSYLEIDNVEEIEVGMHISTRVFQNEYIYSSATECEKEYNNCVDLGALSIEITGETDESLEGTWTLPDSNRSGIFNVNQCKQERGWC